MQAKVRKVEVTQGTGMLTSKSKGLTNIQDRLDRTPQAGGQGLWRASTALWTPLELLAETGDVC